MGDGSFKIVLSPDCGSIAARVIDKDGVAVSESYAVVVKASENVAAEFAAAMIIGQTDQDGVYSSSCLAPGKYLVLASTTPIDRSPEAIAKLLDLRTRAKEIDVSGGSSSLLTISPIPVN